MPRRTIFDPRFSERLRELREAADMSLREVARAVPCSHVHVWELEEGRKAPSPELLRRLDDVLAAGGELKQLGQGTPVAADAGWRPHAEHFGHTEAESLAAELAAVTPSADNALRLAHEWMVAEPPQLYEMRAGRRIGATTVVRIEERVHQLRLLDDRIGGADSYTVVRRELAATADLLRSASYSVPVGRRLLVALGELAQLAGWVASDAGRYAEAQRLYLAGARAAQAGGHVAGAANNLSSLAYQMSNRGDHYDAVLLARTAACRANGSASAASRALLQERAAWAHARAGEASQCERALGAVEDAYAVRDPAEDPQWVYWLDSHEIEVMAGRCWTELRRPLRAVPVLRSATARYGEDRARETALYLSWLAEALVQAHELDQAATTALRALTLSRSTRSVRADERVAALREQLSSARGTRAVDEFEDAYRSPVS